MPKKINMTNMETLINNPVEKSVKALIDIPETNYVDKEHTDYDSSTHQHNTAISESSENQHQKYNYSRETINVEGVGTVEKVISEKGKIIGRPNKPTKVKKKPITLTLTPDLYDKVKENAASEHRTTSEYLAMIIEDYLRN